MNGLFPPEALEVHNGQYTLEMDCAYSVRTHFPQLDTTVVPDYHARDEMIPCASNAIYRSLYQFQDGSLQHHVCKDVRRCEPENQGAIE